MHTCRSQNELWYGIGPSGKIHCQIMIGEYKNNWGTNCFSYKEVYRDKRDCCLQLLSRQIHKMGVEFYPNCVYYDLPDDTVLPVWNSCPCRPVSHRL